MRSEISTELRFNECWLVSSYECRLTVLGMLSGSPMGSTPIGSFDWEYFAVLCMTTNLC